MTIPLQYLFNSPERVSDVEILLANHGLFVNESRLNNPEDFDTLAKFGVVKRAREEHIDGLMAEETSYEDESWYYRFDESSEFASKLVEARQELRSELDMLLEISRYERDWDGVSKSPFELLFDTEKHIEDYLILIDELDEVHPTRLNDIERLESLIDLGLVEKTEDELYRVNKRNCEFNKWLSAANMMLKGRFD